MKIGIIILLASISAIFFTFNKKKDQKSFNFFSFSCSIYDRTGKIYFSLPNFYFCDFNDEGYVIAANHTNNRLVLFNHQDRILWETNENVHHMVKFDDEGKNITAISSEKIKLGKYWVKSDCVSKRTLENKILHQWCIGDHLGELEALGFNKKAILEFGTGEFPTDKTVKYEISHTNSIHLIPENKLSKKHAAFTKGNYLIHIKAASMSLLILDAKMEKILWYKNLNSGVHDQSGIVVESHDWQVLPEGLLLGHINYVVDYNDKHSISKEEIEISKNNQGMYSLTTKWENRHSSLIEYDPFNDKIIWSYKSPQRKDFNFGEGGGVRKMKNGNYFFNHNTTGGRVFEIDSLGKILWQFSNPELSIENLPKKFLHSEPFERTNFLNKRNLI